MRGCLPRETEGVRRGDVPSLPLETLPWPVMGEKMNDELDERGCLPRETAGVEMIDGHGHGPNLPLETLPSPVISRVKADDMNDELGERGGLPPETAGVRN